MYTWKEKLCSRKLWATIVSFVTAILYAFGVAESEIERIAALVAGFGTICVYIFGQAKVDAAAEAANQYVETCYQPEKEAVIGILEEAFNIIYVDPEGNEETNDEGGSRDV